jgi:hypothetical protein
MNRKVKELKARKCEAHPVGDRTYEVLSTSGETYTVVIGPSGYEPYAVCSCKWGQYRPNMLCSHIVRALAQFLAGSTQKITLSLWTTYTEAHRQHKKILDTPEGLWLTVNR